MASDSAIAVTAGGDVVAPGDVGPLSGRPALPSSISTAHFVIHYDPSNSDAAYAQRVGDEAEIGWSRLVAGGAGSRNAGLTAPVDDGDGKVDGYVSDEGLASAGVAHPESPTASGWSGYFVIDPGLGAYADEVAVHEFAHLIQFSYFAQFGPFPSSVVLEGGADWAVLWALDIASWKNPFSALSFSLEAQGSLSAMPDSGYSRWLFFARQVEDFGPDFMADLWGRRLGTIAALDATIAAQSAGAETVGTRFAAFAHQVWVPAGWSTTAVTNFLTDRWYICDSTTCGPLATTVALATAAPDTGWQSTDAVGHLSARYVSVIPDDADRAAPGDQIRISVEEPGGLSVPTSVLVGSGPGGPHTEVALSDACGAARCATIAADRATMHELLLPLVNDNDDASSPGVTFKWRAELLRATPAPPANDERSGARVVASGESVVTDNAYASGTATDEVPACTSWADQPVARGVWFRFTVPADGRYQIDWSGSDFTARVAIRDELTGVTACHMASSPRNERAGTVYAIYLGRMGGGLGLGHLARLQITALDVTQPVIQLTAPQDGAVFARDAAVLASYACSDGESGVVGCSAPAQSGQRIDTSTSGEKTFTVTAFDVADLLRTATVHYRVTDTVAPRAGVWTPFAGARLSLNQSVLASYTCDDDDGGSGIASCQGTAPVDGGIDTSSLGEKSFQVTARDNEGNETVTTTHYTVVAPDGPTGPGRPIGPADVDGDGVPDERDACPRVPAATVTGCPAGQPPGPSAAADFDGDGVPDARDACPRVRAATATGCPAPVATDTIPPHVTLTVKASQRSTKPILLQLAAGDEDIWASTSGTLSIARASRTFRLKGVTNTFVGRGTGATLTLHPAASVRKAFVRALRRNLAVQLTVVAEARDRAGNQVTVRKVVHLR